MAETRPNEYLLELIDILARPIQDGGQGMADNQDSPLMRLREKIAEGTRPEYCCPECASQSGRVYPRDYK